MSLWHVSQYSCTDRSFRLPAVCSCKKKQKESNTPMAIMTEHEVWPPFTKQGENQSYHERCPIAEGLCWRWTCHACQIFGGTRGILAELEVVCEQKWRTVTRDHSCNVLGRRLASHSVWHVSIFGIEFLLATLWISEKSLVFWRGLETSTDPTKQTVNPI
jgi:hypothetical protein